MAESTVIFPVALPRSQRVENLAKFLLNLPVDKAWKVTVAEHKQHRSDQQNKYLHAVCYKTLGDAIGYETEEVAEFLCGTHFGWKDKKVPKKPSNPEGIESVPVRTTTSDENGKRDVLSKEAFSDFVAFIQRFAAQRGVLIPDPEERL